MKTQMLALAASVFTSLAAQAAVEVSLVYKTPDATVSATDTIDLWVTLSLSATSDTFSYDGSLSIDQVFGGVPLPLTGNNHQLGLYDQPFASYSHSSKFVSRNCSGTFTIGCDGGPYTIEQGSSDWFSLEEPFVMNAGDSRDFLLATLTPVGGSAPAGSYVFHSGALGFSVHGVGLDGTALEGSIEFSACASEALSCSFTRTVTAVPEPSLLALAAAGLLSVWGVQRRRAAQAR